MMATHVFHKLENSARLFMKKASWGCFVSVFDSSGEPAGHPEVKDSFAPGCPGTEFEVGRTSCDNGVGATVHAPMDYESSMYCSTCCIREELRQSHLCSLSEPIEVPAVEFGEGDISTKAEMRRQRRSRSARISCRLVPLARSASASVDFSGRDYSRALLEQAFDDGYYHPELRNFRVASHGDSSFPLFCFRPLFRGSCYHAHQCDRSPASEFVSICVC